MVTGHWDDVYRSRGVDQVSWFQAEPTTSLRLISEFGPPGAGVVDVGAGASTLVDRLLDVGRDCTVLDVSAEALGTTRRRLSTRAGAVTFVVGDVLEWAPPHAYGVWHDRALFHFLVDDADRARYVDVATRAVPPGGVVVIATFAPDGPPRCSGLPTARYDADGLAATFAPAFTPVHAEREVHMTPAGTAQQFTWAVLRRAAV